MLGNTGGKTFFIFYHLPTSSPGTIEDRADMITDFYQHCTNKTALGERLTIAPEY